MNIDIVVGARPNFMKAAPLFHAVARSGLRPRLIHTGQHWDWNMSGAFFAELRLPEPHAFLAARSGSHATVTGDVMQKYEAQLLGDRPDAVVVIGDVDSTLAAALAAKKLGLLVVHLEAGLRSGDMTMPEEVNRRAVDAIADLFWCPSPDAVANLQREGVPAAAIEDVGNVMIDSLIAALPAIEASDALERLGLTAGRYALATIHRRANVADPRALATIVSGLARLSATLPVIWPLHPHTRRQLQAGGLDAGANRHIRLIDPQPYIAFMALQKGACLVVTDSGGVQEESSFLGIPCLTVRSSTERPITLTHGTSRLIAVERIAEAASQALMEGAAAARLPANWDGRAAGRMARSLERALALRQAMPDVA